MNRKEYLKNYRREHREEQKQYRLKHIEERKLYLKVNKEKIAKQRKGYMKNYYLKNKEKIKKHNNSYRKIYNKINRDKFKMYYQNNKEKINNYIYKRLKTDINYRIAHYLRTRINKVLKNNLKSKTTIKLLGCSIEFLKEHLQKQFKQGMDWQNYGLWHIDHKRPCASFDLSIPEEQRKCFNWTNLQPLWAKENLEKSDKILN